MLPRMASKAENKWVGYQLEIYCEKKLFTFDLVMYAIKLKLLFREPKWIRNNIYWARHISETV